MGFTVDLIIKKLPEEQRLNMATTAWYGSGSKDPSMFPEQIYKRTFALFEEFEKQFKLKQSTNFKELKKLLDETFYNKKNGKKYGEEERYKEISLRLKEIETNLNKKEFKKGDLILIQSLHKEVVEAKDKQFKQVLNKFGLNSF